MAAPVAVGDYIKKFKDLLTKKYKKISSNDLVVKTDDGAGLNIETTVMGTYPHEKIPGPDGSMKITYKNKPYSSKLEVTLDSQRKLAVKVENTSFKGLTLTESLLAVPPYLVDKKTQNNFALKAAYQQSNINTHAELTFNAPSASKLMSIGEHSVKLNGALSAALTKGVSIGSDFEVNRSMKEGTNNLKNWGIGANFKKGGLIFGLYSSKLADLTGGVHYKVNDATTVGLMSVFSEITKEDKKTQKKAKLGFGIEHQFNELTLLQGKTELDIVRGDKMAHTLGYGGVVEYTVPDLSSKIQLTGTLSGTGSSNFGISCTYGDK